MQRMQDDKFRALAHHKNIVLTGPAGTGKTELLMKRYRYLTEECHLPGEGILVLTMNRKQCEAWNDSAAAATSGKTRITSFYSFLKEEIELYFSYICMQCSEIRNKALRPQFLSFDAAQLMVARVVEHHRLHKNAFAALSTDTWRIASALLTNLSRAALSGIECGEIGRRMYLAAEWKDEEKQKLYEEGDAILAAYRSKCLSLGVLDYGLAAEIYRTYLLQHEDYLQQLGKRYPHWIIDDAEDSLPLQVDVIEAAAPHIRSCWIACNTQGGCGDFYGGDFRYAVQHLLRGREQVEMARKQIPNPFMYEFSEMLFDAIAGGKQAYIRDCGGVDRIQYYELRSDMLRGMADCILRLVKEEGISPGDIAIISTHADPVTQELLQFFLQKEQILLRNPGAKEQMQHHPQVRFMLVLACLCHPAWKINVDVIDVRNMMQRLTGWDAVRSARLAEMVLQYRQRIVKGEAQDVSAKEYKEMPAAILHLMQWMKDYLEKRSGIMEEDFFEHASSDVLMDSMTSLTAVQEVRELIEAFRSFQDTISRFAGIHVLKSFVELMLRGVKSYEPAAEQEAENAVLLTTPAAYLSMGLRSQVLLLSSISSKHWMQRSAKELENANVLKPSWEVGQIYHEAWELQWQKESLATVLRNLCKRCTGKVIPFECRYSGDGYINDGLLSVYFRDILGNHGK